MTRGKRRGSMAVDVVQSMIDTWRVLIGEKGCHVAQSRAATWHPMIGSSVYVFKTFCGLAGI